MSEEIAIRTIQHYMYCPHRWGLMEIGQMWAENIYVTKANIMHKHVHEPQHRYNSRGTKVFTSVPVYNDLDEYNLYGVTDCLEFIEDEKGVSINNSEKRYKVSIVEYKPTAPKNGIHREEDVMQIFAQKICVDYTFKCNSNAFIYYSDTKRRIPVYFESSYKSYNNKLQELLTEMRLNMDKGIIPGIKKEQKCSGCSMRDLCMPKLKEGKSVFQEIKKIEQIKE